MDLFHIFVSATSVNKFFFHKLLAFATVNNILFLDIVFNFNRNVLHCIFFKLFFISTTKKNNLFFKNYLASTTTHKTVSIFKNIMLVFRLIRLEYKYYAQFKHIKHKKYLNQKTYTIFIFAFMFKKTISYNFFNLQKKLFLQKISKKKL